jgi:DNA-binding IclR family transcriptional regulator
VPQSVDRAIEVVELCSQRPRTLGELAEALGVHRTTALRLVQSLSTAGFLRKDDSGRLGVGFRLAGLAQSALAQFDLRSVVHPHIVALSERVGHTIQFAVPDGNRLLYIDKIEPPNSITLNTRIGGDVVVNTAGVSKAILAALSPARRDAILTNASWQRYTENTITTAQAMRNRLDQVRQQGWATDEGEYETFSNCVAAPVWGPTGEVAGAISITAFREKADIAALKGLVPTLLTTTAAISRDLGWREPAADNAIH